MAADACLPVGLHAISLCGLHARDLPERHQEAAPVGALIREHPAARFRDAVVAAPALAGFLDPAPFDPAAFLEPVQRRVERREREAQAAAGPLFDQLGDFIAVVALVVHDGQDHDLGAAFFGLVERPPCCHSLHPYMKDGYIYHKGNRVIRRSGHRVIWGSGGGLAVGLAPWSTTP